MPVWLQILLALGGSAVISYVFTQFCISIHHKTDKYKAMVKREKQDEMREVMQQEMQPLSDKVDAIDRKLGDNTAGTITMLRDRMKCSLNYCRKQGYASASDKANWHELYNSYRELGGNHFREYVDQWKDEMDSLPLEKPSKPRRKK